MYCDMCYIQDYRTRPDDGGTGTDMCKLESDDAGKTGRTSFNRSTSANRVVILESAGGHHGRIYRHTRGHIVGLSQL